MERYDKVGYNDDVQQQSLAFDDEYMVQMYTNLVGNYTVFKEPDRRRAQPAGARACIEPVAPQDLLKRLRREQVDSPDLPDVESVACLWRSRRLSSMPSRRWPRLASKIEELQEQVKSWKVQARADRRARRPGRQLDGRQRRECWR